MGALTWNLEFRLQALNTGGLRIVRVAAREQKPKAVVKATGSDIYNSKPWLQKTFAALAQKHFQNNLGWLTDNLIQTMQNQNRLFLPAYGALALVNPILNKRGDLLADLMNIT